MCEKQLECCTTIFVFEVFLPELITKLHQHGATFIYLNKYDGRCRDAIMSEQQAA